MAPPIRFSASITGDRRIDAKLRALEPAVAKTHIRKILRARIKPIAAAARTRMAKDSGAMAEGLKVAATKRSRKGIGIKAQIGDELTRSKTSEAQGRRAKWPFYAGLRELGRQHSNHAIERTFKTARAAARVGIIQDLARALGREAT